MIRIRTTSPSRTTSAPLMETIGMLAEEADRVTAAVLLAADAVRDFQAGRFVAGPKALPLDWLLAAGGSGLRAASSSVGRLG